MKSNHYAWKILAAVAVLSSLVGGCGGVANTVTSTPLQPVNEFLFTVNNVVNNNGVSIGGVTTVPLSNLVAGILSSQGVLTSSVTSAQCAAISSNERLAFVANGTNVISQFTVNPTSGQLVANGQFFDPLQSGGVSPVFGPTSLLVDSTNAFLIAANQNGPNSDIQLMTITDGKLGDPIELVTSAQIATALGRANAVSPTAIAAATVGPQSVLGIAFNNGGAGGLNVAAASIVLNLNALTLGTLSTASAGNSAATTAATAVVFTASGGNSFVNAVTTTGTAAGNVVTSFPVLIVGGDVAPLGAGLSAPITAQGTCIAGDGDGHVFAGSAATTGNVQSFAEDQAGNLVLSGTGSTAALASVSSLQLDPSANEGFISASTSPGTNGNITVFTFSNGAVPPTGTGQSAGENVTQLLSIITL